MPTYILLTKLASETIQGPADIEKLNKAVAEHIRHDCPEVRWIGNYATLGAYDYIDIYEAPNEEVAYKVSAIIRAFGHSVSETWLAMPWDRFRELVGAVK